MKSSIDYPIKSEDISDLNSFIDSLKIDKSINESIYKGGSVEAEKYLRDFIENKAQYYSELKNHPGMNYSSNLSPYLHFGQISPLYIALKIIKSDIKSKKDFLLFCIPKILKNESNSQLLRWIRVDYNSCFVSQRY